MWTIVCACKSISELVYSCLSICTLEVKVLIHPDLIDEVSLSLYIINVLHVFLSSYFCCLLSKLSNRYKEHVT